jgi:hypothetical protein
MTKTYDPKCFELAEHFVGDDQFKPNACITTTVLDARARALAGHIQTSIDDWYEDNPVPKW